ncbi:hypothetical protein SDRG_03227 [Saprolegnia diclina VS20]|uniref:AAA+ ATPase domain-containing protein n=1 Tax=Saprolegnia diclina (strain VS20) TaxID=1156394 RepID=T0QNW0_SAPDV|nr:hypothetical protein SDRG_03227 [Saprolegnia diclina VS20]EQC39804.1 hypothetical protein SDRG_03227 [Saprolegnia diclina VS20]|eukprot:XP_008607076.1 hypothetical protein SDRG_03227 [Saprolegnia diclina VS20]
MDRVAYSGHGDLPLNVARLVERSDGQAPIRCVRLTHAANSAMILCAGWTARANDDDEVRDVQLPPWMLHVLGMTHGANGLVCKTIDVPEDVAESIVIEPLGAFPLQRGSPLLPQVLVDNTLDLSTTFGRQVAYVSAGHTVAVLVLGLPYLFRVHAIATATNPAAPLARVGRATLVQLAQSTDASSTLAKSSRQLDEVWASHPWRERIERHGFAGYENTVDDVLFHLRLVLLTSSEYVASHGLLVRGVHGVGKTLLLQALGAQLRSLGIPVVYLEGMSLMLESAVTTAFPSPTAFLAHKLQSLADFGVLLLDNVEACFEENEVSPMGRSLLQVLDSIGSRRVVVVASSTIGLPASATRVGRLERELELPVPSEVCRQAILRRLLLAAALDAPHNDVAHRVALATGGYVAKDLVRVCRYALASSKLQEAPTVVWQDFVKALGVTTPSQLQTLNVQAPGAALASWTLFAGYSALKNRLLELISYRFERKEALAALGVQSVSGILLYGPSGCGKTTLVRGLAAKCNANFVRVQSSDLLSKYFGETEKSIRDVFARARASAPCILFFDELDAIAEKRAFDSSGGGSSSSVYARVLSTLLNEMDGVGGQASEVIVMAATNRKDALDAALVRPGRIDQALEVGYPDQNDRLAIFESYTRRMPLAEDVDVAALASTPFDLRSDLSKMERAAHMTGADIGAICKAAAFHALRHDVDAASVAMAHFRAAIASRLERV